VIYTLRCLDSGKRLLSTLFENFYVKNQFLILESGVESIEELAQIRFLPYEDPQEILFKPQFTVKTPNKIGQIIG